MAQQENDPARDVDSWDPWADENQDPAPFADRDEDQSATARPRRGGERAVARETDVLAAPLAPSVSTGGVVDLDQLTGDAPPARRPARSRSARAGTPTPRTRTPRSGAVEAGSEPGDGVESAGKPAPKRRSGSFGNRGKGTGNSSFARPEPGAGRSTFKQRAGSGSFGKRPAGGGNSSFGDGGSSGLGSRRGGASKKSTQRTWGIQLDADVEEPTPVDPNAPRVFDEAAAAEEEAADARRRARAAGGTGGGRGRSGSFDRPRRPDGEPAPELEDPEATARQLCLAALTGAAKTRQQLASMLADREIPEDAATAVLDRFAEVGLVDDAAYAAAWISSRQTGRGLSKRALAQELKTKGVDPEVAAVALEAVDPQDEWDAARALVAKKVPAMRRLDCATATRRLIGMLARKGYGGGLAAIVVREALDSDGAAEDAAAVADDTPPEMSSSESVPVAGAEPAVRLGRWSGRPLVEDDPEVGEGLTQDGLARSKPAQRRHSSFGNR